MLTFISESKGYLCGTSCIIYCTGKHLSWINFSLWNSVKKAKHIFFRDMATPCTIHRHHFLVTLKMYLPVKKKLLPFTVILKIDRNTRNVRKKILSHLSDLDQTLKSNQQPKSRTLKNGEQSKALLYCYCYSMTPSFCKIFNSLFTVFPYLLSNLR